MKFMFSYIYMPVSDLARGEIAGYSAMIAPEGSLSATDFFARCAKAGRLHEMESDLFMDTAREAEALCSGGRSLWLNTFAYAGLTPDEIRAIAKKFPWTKGRLYAEASTFPAFDEQWQDKRKALRDAGWGLCYTTRSRDPEEIMAVSNALDSDMVKLEGFGVDPAVKAPFVAKVKKIIKGRPVLAGGLENDSALAKAVVGQADLGQGLRLGRPVRSEIREERDYT